MTRWRRARAAAVFHCACRDNLPHASAPALSHSTRVNEQAKAPLPQQSSTAPRQQGREVPAQGGIEQQTAIAFLTGKSPLTPLTMVGLHQGLIDPALVQRVIAAQEAGA